MGSYRVTFTSGAEHQMGIVTPERLRELNDAGRLVAVHGPTEIRDRLAADLGRQR